MSRVTSLGIVLALLGSLAACAESATPPEEPGVRALHAQQAREERARQAQQAQLQASLDEQASRQVAAREAMRQQQEALNAQVDATAKALAAANDPRKREADYLASIEKKCVETRESRARNAQSVVKQRTEWVARMNARSKEIRSACKVVTRNTGEVRVQHESGGFRVSPVQRDDVSCPGGVPHGITKDDVYVFLSWVAMGTPTGDPADDIVGGDHAAEDMVCTKSDLEAGLDTNVKFGDREGIQRLQAWQPKPAE